MSISKETIVEASINILNRDGIEGLNMRAIAKELGIKAASLYWHIKGKLELYGEITEYMCTHNDLPIDVSDSKRFLTEMFTEFRAMLVTVRDSVPIFEESIPNTPRRIEIIRAVTESLLALGIEGKNVMTVSNMLNNYVLSFVADEMRLKSRTPEEISGFGVMLGFRDDVLTFGQDFDEQFEYGLKVLLAGLIVSISQNQSES